MAQSYRKIAGRLACAMLLRGVILSAVGAPVAAIAQDVPADQILKALTPPITRSLNGSSQPAMSESDRKFIDSLRGRTRSLSVDEGEHVAKIAREQPKIDLEIYFDFNSAAITAKAVPQLNELAKALRSAQLDGSTILLSGYTDAKGTEEYNQKLSEGRAQAVKQYLVRKLKLSATDLTTAGYGKRDLKDKADPYAAANRRVQIVNLGPANQAHR